MITPEESRKQAQEFIAWRDKSRTRRSNKEILTGADRYRHRTTIDSKLADRSYERDMKEIWD